ncbi:hypothetical protein [Chitinophaga vietnamensis]|uniref:hypothetical protein n=1 Tax=Chitinophaga vietnamensis TaxID=2593957 RepID=UPI00117785E2|nr:hypothetical protein [Chitinophaga vietnamensis]
MKISYLFIPLLSLCTVSAYAQKNTPPLPTGKIGIGTDSPTAQLDVRGDFSLGVLSSTGGQAYSIGFTRSGAQLYGTAGTGLQMGGSISNADLTILPNGNIGVGITSPGARLHIVNNVQQIQLGTGTCTSGYSLMVGANDDGVNFSNNSNARGFNFSNINGNLFNVSAAGNMGLGKTASDLKLDVNGVFRSNGMVGLFGPGTAAELSTTTKRGLYVDNGTNTAWDLLTLQNGSGTLMKINGAGNVSIGTNNSRGYKLAVEGTVGARRVKVSQENWADYVFHPDYKFPTIEEMEQYVVKEHHLPGVPSAEEVKNNGIDLGDMNKVLLQKIEELSLYIILLKKQLDTQQAQITALQKQH